MIAAVFLAVQTVPSTPAVPTPVPTPPVAPMAAAPPVADWPLLPPFPLPRTAALLDAPVYVRDEVTSGRCRATASGRTDTTLIAAPVAILVGPRGGIRRIVPQAIDCPTVEQYTVGYLLSVTRASAMLPPAPGWYRSIVTYRW